MILDATKRINGLSPRERSEAWLNLIVDQSADQDGWGVTDFSGYEAHAYFASRARLAPHHRKIIKSNFEFAINAELE